MKGCMWGPGTCNRRCYGLTWNSPRLQANQDKVLLADLMDSVNTPVASNTSYTCSDTVLSDGQWIATVRMCDCSHAVTEAPIVDEASGKGSGQNCKEVCLDNIPVASNTSDRSLPLRLGMRIGNGHQVTSDHLFLRPCPPVYTLSVQRQPRSVVQVNEVGIPPLLQTL